MQLLNQPLLLVITALSIQFLISTSSHASQIYMDSSTEGGDSLFSGELLTSSCEKVGVIMYHGRGASPTGPVVEELRNSLYHAGYTTLSIDNPVPLNGMTDFTSYVNDIGSDDYVFTEAYARMRTGINHLSTLGVEKIVVAGFSMGARLASAHIARGYIDELPMIGLIGIGMYGTSIEPLNISSTLDEVTVPVLDLYGDGDTNAANTAAARFSAYNSGAGANYTQSILSCIDGLNCHQLEGLKGNDSMPLEIEVLAWMQGFAPAESITDCTPISHTQTSKGGELGTGFIILLLIIILLCRPVSLIFGQASGYKK